MTVYTTLASPLGELLLTGEEVPTARHGLTLSSVTVPGQRNAPSIGAGWRSGAAALAEPVRQLEEYFAGRLRAFELDYTPAGSEFQRRVWRALDALPYGATVSYGQVTERIGARWSAARSVGTAIGANPLLIVRPCHRVIGAGGALTGYAGGLHRKERLLVHEGAWRPSLGCPARD